MLCVVIVVRIDETQAKSAIIDPYNLGINLALNSEVVQYLHIDHAARCRQVVVVVTTLWDGHLTLTTPTASLPGT